MGFSMIHDVKLVAVKTILMYGYHDVMGDLCLTGIVQYRNSRNHKAATEGGPFYGF